MDLVRLRLRCPICAARPLPFGRKDGRALLICKDCRHVFWRSNPSEATLRRYYAGVYTAGHQSPDMPPATIAYYRSHIEELARAADVPVPELAVADVGCSYPVLMAQAVDLGVRIALGVDWSQEAHAYAADRSVPILRPDRFMRETPDRSLDVLRYSHVLEHLFDPVGMLRMHISKLRSGGVVYITQPNIPVLKPARTDVDLKDAVWPNHLHFFSPLSLTRLVEQCGLRMEGLFTVEGEEEAARRFEERIDDRYVRQTLAKLADAGDANRGPLNNYPHYTGENATALARKP